MVKMIKSLMLAIFAAFAITLSTGMTVPAQAGSEYRKGYSLEEIVDRLEERGFYNIRVTDKKPPYYDFKACFKGRKYELTIDYKGNLKDKDYEGRCRHDKRVDVDVPYARVKVDESGVRVRAPYVDLKVAK